MGGQHHAGPWSNEDQKLVNLCPGLRAKWKDVVEKVKPPIKGGSAPEEEEAEEEEEVVQFMCLV